MESSRRVVVSSVLQEVVQGFVIVDRCDASVHEAVVQRVSVSVTSGFGGLLVGFSASRLVVSMLRQRGKTRKVAFDMLLWMAYLQDNGRYASDVIFFS